MVKIAFDNGWITEIHKIYEYRARKIFRDYVTDIYSLRKKAKLEGNIPKALLLKYLLNSLYGKFGQKKFGEWVRVTDKLDLDFQVSARTLEKGLSRWQGYPRGDLNNN